MDDNYIIKFSSRNWWQETSNNGRKRLLPILDEQNHPIMDDYRWHQSLYRKNCTIIIQIWMILTQQEIVIQTWMVLYGNFHPYLDSDYTWATSRHSLDKYRGVINCMTLGIVLQKVVVFFYFWLLLIETHKNVLPSSNCKHIRQYNC